MSRLRFHRYLALLCIAALLFAAATAVASEYRGQVVFGEVAVPGAVVTATQGAKKVIVSTNEQGMYMFPDLADGAWTIEVEMLCFAPMKQEVTIAPSLPPAKWELKLLPLAEIMARANAPKPQPKPALSARAAADKGGAAQANNAPPPDLPKPAEDAAARPSDGLLVNGSINNAATSQYTLAAAFGNSRSSKSLYSGGLSLTLDNSVFDARPYSLTGQSTNKPSYNDITGGLTFGGPLNIPHLLPRGPNVNVGYQWTRNRGDSTLAGLVPTVAQRNETVPGMSLSAVAQNFLSLYPMPNVSGGAYNYQTAAVSNAHQDSLRIGADRAIGRKDSANGVLALQSTRSDAQSLFGFVDTTDVLGLNATVNWNRRFRQFYNTVGYRFSRTRVHVTPQFENRQNVSGNAGIAASPAAAGSDQDPADWGPPTLVFSSGIASLTDGQSALNRNETNAVSESVTWTHRRHNVTVGGDLRRQEFNYFTEQNPRGTYTFIGSASVTGSDFGDFLVGIPDTSAIAFGNPDKYLRQSVYDVFVNDDWRLRPELTIDAGVRWDYGAPATELKGRLVNLDVASGFSTVAPVLGSTPVGALTGASYPGSLIRPDKRGFGPRIGVSWRPILGSSLILRGGYGIYDDTSVYQGPAALMDQQAPLSKSVNEPYNASTCPLTLANGFPQCAATTADNFAIDPNFRVGYAQSWNLSVQRDLPGALVATVTYTGIKGTRGVQESLPNSYPIGAANPCPSCPSGFVYRGSNGNSTREAGQVQLRRRLRSGFSASLLYNYSKSIDDDSFLGGQGPLAAGATSASQPTAAIAQNWRNLSAERGLSTFDQRHLLNVQMQYTSGQGIGGGTLLSGWRGTLLKEWTVLSSIAVGTGLPETPVYLATTPGTGVTNSIRPNLTGASLYAAPAGYHLNSAAYTAPLSGQWGDARRDSIAGPSQFTLSGSLQRTFRVKDHLNLDARADATNLFNHAVYTNWNNIFNSATFGLPAAVNPMRSIQITVRLRY